MTVTSDAEWVQEITVDADMPDHGHGMVVKPRVTKLGPQRWRVDGMKFHMPGEWEVYVDLIAAERSERSVFPIVVEPF
ncbi:MAG: FixH family protein [Planctomycetota bacterium]|jgi:hypothetical protein|nr:FixH family protein [Planctomycetota bacterium]